MRRVRIELEESPTLNPPFLRFIWKVNELAAFRGLDKVFGTPTCLSDDGLTEEYEEARIDVAEEEAMLFTAKTPRAEALFKSAYDSLKDEGVL